MLVGKRILVNLPPGVNKNDNSYTTFGWSDTNRVRFFKYYPQKIGGWIQVAPDVNNSQPIQGTIRSLFSWRDSGGIEHLMIGSSYGLYDYVNGQILNITPLSTTLIPLGANPITTYHATMVNNPFSVTNGSPIVTMDITAFPSSAIFQAGDTISISGATAVANITAPQLNTVQLINSVTTTTITFGAPEFANATTTGGGASVVVGTQVVTVAYVNTLMNGDRIKISGATSIGTLLNTDLNIEAVVRNVTGTTFDYYLNSVHYSNSAGAGGGAGVNLQLQIAPGNPTYEDAYGYGGNLYGTGMYGTPRPFIGGFLLPQIWSFDLFGEGIVLTPGNGGNVYSWQGNDSIAPIPLTSGGAPTAVNYVFTSHGEAVVFGAGGVPNQITTSDTANLANWTPGASTNAFSATIPGATELIGHGFVRDQDVLFTRDAVYSFNYLGKPILWEVRKISESDGLIAPKAVTSVNDLVFWMGNNDFYVYNGSVYTIIPNNTVKNWVYQNMNWGLAYLSFIRPCLEFNEIWFFFPFANSAEPNAYVIYNFEEGTWANGFLTRTAAEEPSNEARPQYMATSGVPVQLWANPISVTNGSNIATITFDPSTIEALDVNMYINIAGITGTIGGISATIFNNMYRIVSITGSYLTIALPSNATSTAIGGGDSATLAIAPNVYQHEVQYGDGDENTPFEASITTGYALIDEGDFAQQISRVVPSSDILYDMDFPSSSIIYQLTISTKMYDGDAYEVISNPYNVSMNTNKIDLRALGRQRKYTFNSNTSYPFRIQKWFEEIKQSTPR